MSKVKRCAASLPAAFYVALGAISVLVIGMASLFVFTSGSGGGMKATPAGLASLQISLPAYVLDQPPDVQEAYLFAVERPDVLMWIPCYCGCGGHSGHKSSRDCFVKGGNTPGQLQFDEHGSQCDICVGIALDAKRMSEEGRSLRAIRDYIDATYGSVGPGTDTPLPPG